MQAAHTARTSHPVADDAAATIPLAFYSAAVAAGFARVFSGWQFLDNLLVLVVLGHGLSFLMRRGRVSGWIAVPLIALVLGWAIGAMHYRFTYSYLLPTSDTWNLFTSELELVRDQFSTAVAPVIFGGGWDVLASIGVAGSVLIADTFAFRAAARAEALVPGGVLFVFVAALGDDRDRISLTVLLIGAGVLATAMLRAYHSGRISSIGGRRSASGLALPGAIGAALVIALSAGLVGPALPGANAEPIYDATEGGSDPSGPVSPLVDIKARLTNRSNTEMFIVQSNVASYWRSTALADFDGRRWGIPERRLESAEGVLGTGTPGADREIRQNLRIVNLGGTFVPAAPDPVGITAQDTVRVAWSEQDATLFAVDHTLTAGDEFAIVSSAPVLDGSSLADATSIDPGDPIYMELPEGFPDVARETAVEVTAGASTSYEAAVLLQDWFRAEFEYSLEAQSGHGSNAIASFLREKVGYCEQFAGAYAAMLRSIGIPTRVAVGYTSGIEQNPGTYSVRGKNAHAWPEVWFDDVGWVLFEPTPGRGAPGAEGYTSVAPAQDDSATATGAEVVEDAGEQPTPTTAPATDEFDPSILGDEFLDTSAAGAIPEEPAPSPSRPDVPILPALGVLAVVVLAPALSRWLARRRPGAPEVQMGRYWQRALRSLEDVGVPLLPGATPIETATGAAERFPIAARPARGLAQAVTEATYRADGTRDLDVLGSYGHSTIRDCASWSRQIERAVTDSMSVTSRLVRHFTRWR
jgi:transglutaminase-like putative cysteine protease